MLMKPEGDSRMCIILLLIVVGSRHLVEGSLLFCYRLLNLLFSHHVSLQPETVQATSNASYDGMIHILLCPPACQSGRVYAGPNSGV